MTALLTFNDLLTAAADVFSDAILSALLGAGTRGDWPGYADAAPSVRL